MKVQYSNFLQGLWKTTKNFSQDNLRRIEHFKKMSIELCSKANLPEKIAVKWSAFAEIFQFSDIWANVTDCLICNTALKL
jgi:hypothetical protein